MTHDHDDVDRLTIGCPGCAMRVAADQLQAEVDADGQLRHCTFTYKALGRANHTKILLRCLPGWTMNHVLDFYRAELHDAALARIPHDYPSGKNTESARKACHVTMVVIGNVVTDAVPVVPPAESSLFG